MWAKAMRWLALGGLLALGGCGGGGGDGSDGKGGQFAVRFTPATIQVSQVEGYRRLVTIAAKITYNGSSDLYLFLEEDNDLVEDADLGVVGQDFFGTLTLKASPAGSYTTRLRLRGCLDQNCTREAGEAGVLTLQVEMLPNIAVASSVELQRRGREPAPEAVIPVTVPSAAGTVTLQLDTPHPENFNVVFDGTHLRVSTRQEPSGEYRATAHLTSSSDSRYRRSVDIRYVVTAPPGGDQPLQISDRQFDVYLNQGAVVTRRFHIVRPSWTDALEAPTLSPSSILSLRSLGNDEYEVTIDATSLPVDNYYGYVSFSAGPTGGNVSLDLRAYVGAPMTLPNPLHFSLNAVSTVSDLRLSSPVLSADGVPQRWTARSLVPWLHLPRSTGTTGVDNLLVEIEPSSLPDLTGLRTGTIELSIDRPGTLPMTVVVGMGNGIPRLDIASMRTLVGARGRIYVEGFIPDYYASRVAIGVLQVDGARLVEAVTVPDTRFVGDVSVLRVDVDGAVPGRDITIRVNSPLMPTQVRVAAEAPVQVPTGYATLPFGSYRPLQYAAGRNAAYFAGPGTIYRWSHDNTNWHLGSVGLPGLIDVALQPDEATLFATSDRDLVAFDPVTLNQTARGSLQESIYGDSRETFDLTPPAGFRALAFSADLRAFAAKRRADIGFGEQTGIAWLSILDPIGVGTWFGWGDPGTSLYGSALGSSIVRSAGGHAVVSLFGPTAGRIYRPETRRSVEINPPLPAAWLAAVSDDGNTMLFDNGLLRRDGVQIGNVFDALPTTHVVGGLGVSGDGHFAIVYGYRVAVEAGLERARDAVLWVVDLRGAPALPLFATLPLPDAVGCTTALAIGETCRHEGRVAVAEGAGSAFVIGPRGVAAVSLPNAVVTAQAATNRVRAMSAQNPSRGSGIPIKGVLRPTSAN